MKGKLTPRYRVAFISAKAEMPVIDYLFERQEALDKKLDRIEKKILLLEIAKGKNNKLDNLNTRVEKLEEAMICNGIKK